MANTLLQEAQIKIEQGHIEQAQALLEQVLHGGGNDKMRGEAALQLGKLFLLQDDEEKALVSFQQAVGYLPDDARTHFYLGVAYREQEEWQAALDAFQRADKLHPNDAAIMAHQGSMQFQLSEGKRGKELLNQALRIDPSRHRTLLDLALVYLSEQDFVAASLCARHALQFQPGDDRAEDTLYTIQELQYRFEDRGKIDAIRRSLPRTRKDWQRWISTVTSPSELLSSLAEHTPPDSQEALQALAQRAMKEWNRYPRPELGGLSPEQATKLTPKPSRVEDPRTYPWLSLDNRLAEQNPVRRDMVAFLTHLDESNYKATDSLGNLPLKGVRAVNELLTQPAPLKHMVGDEVISEVRLVSDVWAIFFLQGLAMMNNLAVFEPGRRITLTEEGRRFLDSSPSRQLWMSFYAWWWVAEWDMAYSWEVFDDFSQTGLPFFTRQLLLTMPIGKRIEGDEFVAIVGEMLQAAQAPMNPMLLKPAVKFMILNVLEDFEIITLKKKAKNTSGLRIEQVVWFKVTPFGHQLLRSI